MLEGRGCSSRRRRQGVIEGRREWGRGKIGGGGIVRRCRVVDWVCCEGDLIGCIVSRCVLIGCVL